MATESEYVKAPEAVQPDAPVEDQLSELKIAAKGKINEFVDKATVQYEQAANDPANKASTEKLKRDVDATAQDAATSYTKALNQLGEAFHKMESTGKQATTETATSAQQGQSALQEGITKVHDAISEGAAVTNQKLQETSNSSTPRGFGFGGPAHHEPGLFESLGNAISSTAQSVKDAFVAPSPTAHQSHSTPTSTNLPVTHYPAQSVSESLGQTAAALRDAIKNTWAPPDSANPHHVQPKE
jgi:hypothetical protein